MSILKNTSDKDLIDKVLNSNTYRSLYDSLGYKNLHGRFGQQVRDALKTRCLTLGYDLDVLYERKTRDNDKTIKVCPSCGKTFTGFYSKTCSGKYCSSYCSHVRGHPKTIKPKINHHCDVECLYCHKPIHTTISNGKTRKFCNGTCRNLYNNQFNNGCRSKAEELLSQAITETFPNLYIITNDRKTLKGLELDIIIPELNFAIEWNGVWHYKKTLKHTDLKCTDTYQKIHSRDLRKKKLCKMKGIELLVIKDMTSHKKFIDRKIREVLEIIRQKL